jgi:hypothetical protein
LSPWILERFSDPNKGPPPWLLLPAAASLLAGGFLLESKRGSTGRPDGMD